MLFGLLLPSGNGAPAPHQPFPILNRLRGQALIGLGVNSFLRQRPLQGALLLGAGSQLIRNG